MFKKLFTAIIIVSMTLVLVPACAEQDKDAVAVAGETQSTETPVSAPAAETTKPGMTTDGAQVSVMDLPVNFSTPEDVEKSIENVRQQAGAAEATELTNALGYILAYDLSVGHDKEKMYQKLNGRTPNAIIAKMKR